MDPDDESPNPPERADVTSGVPPVTTHSWLGNDDPPSSWAPPASGSTPPPPPPPALVPAPPGSTLAPTATRPMSGYDAPAPESRWHTYLQQGDLPTQGAPTRPRATVAGALLLGGAGLAALGSVLTWATFPDAVAVEGIARTFNGFTDIAGESKDGPFFAAFAAILAGLGITLLLAKRIAGVLILGAIVAGFGAAAAVIDLLDVADPDGVPTALQPSVGIGLPVVVGGFVLAFAGSLAGLVTGRTAT
jgi:hypothetical protein